MRCRLALLSVALLGTTLALPAAAQWKWRTANGQIQYSDLPPPPGVSEKDILQRPTAASLRAAAPTTAPAASAASQPGKSLDPELEARRKKNEQEEAAKAKAEEQRVAAAKAENCNRAREQLRTLESGMRIARVNEKGEREILDDKLRADETKRARDVAAANCAK
jgi:hypothetical protein